VTGHAESIIDHFRRKPKCNDGYYILTSIDELLGYLLQADTGEIVISKVTIYKNIEHHPDLELNDYLILDKIVGKYDVLLQDGTHSVALVSYEFGSYFYALKSTQSGKKVFLSSFRKTSSKDLKRWANKIEKGKVKLISGVLQ